MSDTKMQLRNSKNRRHINHLNRLYRQEKSIRMEIRYVENMIKNGQLYISIGNYQDYDIFWMLRVLKGDLISNQSMINAVRSELIIC